MKKWNGVGSPSTYIFWLVCFCIGFAVLKLLSLCLLQVYDRDGPGLNPFSKTPDGQLAISEFAVSVVGFAVLAAIAWLLSQLRA